MTLRESMDRLLQQSISGTSSCSEIPNDAIPLDVVERDDAFEVLAPRSRAYNGGTSRSSSRANG